MLVGQHIGPFEVESEIGTGVLGTVYLAKLSRGDGTVVPRTAGVWTASFGFPLSGPLGATVEFFGFRRTTGPAGSNATAALLVGPTFLLREWLALDAGGIIPLAGPQPRALYAGFVWNFGCALPRRLCG